MSRNSTLKIIHWSSHRNHISWRNHICSWRNTSITSRVDAFGEFLCDSKRVILTLLMFLQILSTIERYTTIHTLKRTHTGRKVASFDSLTAQIFLCSLSDFFSSTTLILVELFHLLLVTDWFQENESVLASVRSSATLSLPSSFSLG